jgi:hypothetical protein
MSDNHNYKVWSVWYDGGDEANSYYLTYNQAEDLAFELEQDGYEVTIIDMSVQALQNS